MISLDQINEEIAALEAEKPTFQVMEKLADLYVVRDHIIDRSDKVTDATQKVHIGSNSEFAKCVDGKCVESILELFDELMETLLVINPRLYDGVMRKI